MSQSTCNHCDENDVHTKSRWRFSTADALRICTPISGLLLAIGFTWQFTPERVELSFFFYILSILVGGVFVLKSAISGLVKKRFLNISFLVTIAAIGALYIGEYGEAAAVVFLFSLAEFFETFKTQFRLLDNFLEENSQQIQQIATDIGRTLADAVRFFAKAVIFVKENFDIFLNLNLRQSFEFRSLHQFQAIFYRRFRHPNN